MFCRVPKALGKGAVSGSGRGTRRETNEETHGEAGAILTLR
jgi:hypothetical protein